MLITVDLGPADLRHLRHALADHAHLLRRNGVPGLPAGLAALAAQLDPPEQPENVTPEERTRALAAERTRRWRARRRGENVPVRRGGRPKTVTNLAG